MITIGDGWRIESDGIQWMLQRQRVGKKTGRVRWDNVAYTRDLFLAFQRAVELDLMREATLVPEEAAIALLQALTGLQRDIQSALGQIGEEALAALMREKAAGEKRLAAE